jgi:hypothetical protein
MNLNACLIIGYLVLPSQGIFGQIVVVEVTECIGGGREYNQVGILFLERGFLPGANVGERQVYVGIVTSTIPLNAIRPSCVSCEPKSVPNRSKNLFCSVSPCNAI